VSQTPALPGFGHSQFSGGKTCSGSKPLGAAWRCRVFLVCRWQGSFETALLRRAAICNSTLSQGSCPSAGDCRRWQGEGPVSHPVDGGLPAMPFNRCRARNACNSNWWPAPQWAAGRSACATAPKRTTCAARWGDDLLNPHEPGRNALAQLQQQPAMQGPTYLTDCSTEAALALVLGRPGQLRARPTDSKTNEITAGPCRVINARA